jgi:outer membrane immunogenic protein
MRIAITALAFAGLSLASVAAASAADLPVKAPMMSRTELSASTWTGLYLGANVGYGWANVGTAGVSNDLNGVIGGGQIGYNWQMGSLVLGVEGDLQGSSESRSDGVTVGGVPYTLDQSIPWFGTLRGRIGYAFGPAMLYFTGGGAWENYKLTVSSPGLGSASDNATKSAWTIGGGAEWMFAPKWSAKVEYLYMDTGDTSVTLGGATFTGHAQNNIVRVGLNYHF